jgi:A/G-specific adenine glycosylase
MIELSTDWKRRFRRRLRNWYLENRRDLPWRKSRDPYRVWVSEIMLQQTQVATVRDYFTRFIDQFPDVQSLAAASEQEVLRAWEGLGYYRRARQMHTAAQAIVAEHGGEFPRDVAALQRLPGIGRYTAGAIASIALGRPAPILEANTVRLYARLVAYRGIPSSSDGKRALWNVAESLVPCREPGEFNQALMELGSLVCTPREARCTICPVSGLCGAHVLGLAAQIPPPKPRPVYESVHEAAVVVRQNGKVLLRQCTAGERWAGLWDFPRVPIPLINGTSVEDVLREKIQERFGTSIEIGERLATIKHGVTRFRITLDCYTARLKRTRRPTITSGGLRWVAQKRLSEFPLSTTGRQIAELIDKRRETRDKR